MRLMLRPIGVVYFARVVKLFLKPNRDAFTGIPDTIPMGLIAAFQSGAAALTTGDLDYIGAFQTR